MSAKMEGRKISKLIKRFERAVEERRLTFVALYPYERVIAVRREYGKAKYALRKALKGAK